MSNRSLLLGWRERWNRSLLQFLRRRVRAPVEIDDLAQETYLRLLRTHDLTQVRNPQAYLLKVAGHVISEWRDNQPPQDPLNLLDDLAGEGDLECELDAQISQAHLDELLARVSPAMRAVLLLRFRDDYSHKEIAQALGLTLRQVRRHLIRGYEYLRESLQSQQDRMP